MNICGRLKAQNSVVLNVAFKCGTKLKCNLIKSDFFTCQTQKGFFLFLFIFGEAMLLCCVKKAKERSLNLSIFEDKFLLGIGRAM